MPSAWRAITLGRSGDDEHDGTRLLREAANERFGLKVVGVLNRSDFDMKFNQALGRGVLVGDKVNVALDISAVKQV